MIVPFRRTACPSIVRQTGDSGFERLFGESCSIDYLENWAVSDECTVA
jgi:hypothetical protein